GQRGLDERGGAAEDRDEPHPEHRAGPADGDGDRHAGDVAGPHPRGGGDREGPEGRDALPAGVDLRRFLSDRPQHLREQPDLYETRDDGIEQHRRQQQREDEVTVDVIDEGDEIGEGGRSRDDNGPTGGRTAPPRKVLRWSVLPNSSPPPPTSPCS